MIVIMKSTVDKTISYIKEHTGCITLAELADNAGVPISHIRKCLDILIRQGRISKGYVRNENLKYRRCTYTFIK